LKGVVVLAFLAILCSALTSAAAYSIIVMSHEPLTGPGTVGHLRFSGVVATVITWLALFIGLVALIVFAATNFYGA
jgi:hypothetical protein